jgi:hypothetical protein
LSGIGDGDGVKYMAKAIMCQFADALATIGIPLADLLANGRVKYHLFLEVMEGERNIVKHMVGSQALQEIKISWRRSRDDCVSRPASQLSIDFIES